MSDNNTTTRIRGYLLKTIELPTPLLVLMLATATAAQVWYNSRFGVLLVMSGVILGYCVPTKTNGQGFWTFKTYTVLGVPLLVTVGALLGVAITLVTFLVKLALLAVFGLLLLFFAFKAWRNKDALKEAFRSARSFGQ